MLAITDLQVSIESKKKILLGVDLVIPNGEIHLLVGKNGSGKSSLIQTVIGNPVYQVENGTLFYNDTNLSELAIHERALNGIFASFQNPIELEGVNLAVFLRTILNKHKMIRGESELSGKNFLILFKSILARLGLSDDFVKRNVGEGMSGGEKKLCQMLELLIIDPKLCLLDEIDSGLDIDKLKTVQNIIEGERKSDRRWLIVTHHFQNWVDFAVDKVHIIEQGKIVRSGTRELLSQLQSNGFIYD